MTDIDKLELNARMAEQVMGWKSVEVVKHAGIRRYTGVYWERPDGTRILKGDWNPSTDWTAAGKVMEKITGEHADEFAKAIIDELGIWEFRMAIHAVSDALSRLTPLAICVAAYKTVKLGEDDE